MNALEKRTYFLLALLVWIYLWLRAWQVPIIYDEAATFFHYVLKGEFIPGYAHWDANNHILNSALSILSYKLFGDLPLALRLPNLLVSVLFFVYCWKIGTRIRSPFLRWVFILSLLLAHSFVDYFTLSRGYGMSMALLFAALWYLMRSYEKATTRNYLLTLLFVNLAVLANLTLVITEIIVLVLLLLNLWGREKPLVPALSTVFLGFLPFGFFVKLLFFMKAKGLLYYGSLAGFREVTVWSLVKYLTGFESLAVQYLVVAVALFALAAWLVLVWRKRWEKPFSNPGLLFGWLLAGNVAAILLNAWLFRVNYPEDRAGLFLFPFFVGTLVFAADSNFQPALKKGLVATASLLLFFPLHFFSQINLSHNSLENHRLLQRFYDKVLTDWQEDDYPPVIGSAHNKDLMWAYLNFKSNTHLPLLSTSSYPSPEPDYQITGYDNDPDWFTVYDTLDYDPQTGFCLAKRKQLLKRRLIQKQEGITKAREPVQTYFNLLEGRADSLAGRSLQITFRLNLSTDADPFDAWVVFTVRGEDNEQLRYEFVPFHWLQLDWSDPSVPMENSVYVNNLPGGSKKYVLFVWNIDKVPYEIVDGQAEVFVLENM